MNTRYDTDFETRSNASKYQETNFSAKFWRFVRYLSTRKIESWGFFIAGLMIGGLFF